MESENLNGNMGDWILNLLLDLWRVLIPTGGCIAGLFYSYDHIDASPLLFISGAAVLGAVKAIVVIGAGGAAAEVGRRGVGMAFDKCKKRKKKTDE